MQEVIKKSKELENGDLQLLVDCLSMVGLYSSGTASFAQRISYKVA